MNKIRIGIVGYGNIGRGVELAIERNDDMELVAVVTRRNPEDVNILTEGVKKVHLDDVLSLKGEVDVMILCGGSATDLPVMGPQIAKNFNIIDSFDTHAKIPEYFANVDAAACKRTSWCNSLLFVFKRDGAGICEDGISHRCRRCCYI